MRGHYDAWNKVRAGWNKALTRLPFQRRRPRRRTAGLPGRQTRIESLEVRQMLAANLLAGPAVGLDFDAAQRTAELDTTLFTDTQSGSQPSGDAGSRTQLDAGRYRLGGDDFEQQVLVQFDLTGFAQDTTGATVTLHPVAWSNVVSTQSAEAIFDHNWNEQSSWATQPDFSPAIPLSTTAGAGTWTVASGDTTPIELDVSAAVRQSLRQGDLNFDTLRGAAGVAGDVAALELLLRNPDAYQAIFAPVSYDRSGLPVGTSLLDSTVLLDSANLLERADLDRSGQIDADDAELFLAAHGYLPGDLDFDGQVDGTDFLRWQRQFGQPASYSEGDVDFSGSVDGQDLALFASQFGAPAPAPVQEKLSIRIFAAATVPDAIAQLGYGSREHPDAALRPALQVEPAYPVARSAAQASGLDEAGRALHVWLTDQADGFALVGQRLDADGNPLGGPRTIATGSAAMRPSVALNRTGDAVVAWQQQATVFYRRYHLIGSELVAGAAVEASGNRPATVGGPVSVGLDDAGQVTLVWQAETAAAEPGLFYQTFQVDDRPLLAAPAAVPEGPSSESPALGRSGQSLAVAADGPFAIVWQEGRRLRVRRFDASGLPLAGSEEVVSLADTASGTVLGDAGVLAAETGDLLVAWWQQNPGPDGTPETTLVLRRYDAATGAWQPNRVLVDFQQTFGPAAAWTIADLQLATDGLGHLGAVWTQATGGQAAAAYVAWFTDQGQPVVAPMPLSPGVASRAPSLNSTGQGHFQLGWIEAATVYAQPFDWTEEPQFQPHASPALEELSEQFLEAGSVLTIGLQAVYPGAALDQVLIEPAPGNPEGLSVTMGSGGSATLSWEPPPGTPTGLHLLALEVRDSAAPARHSRTFLPVRIGSANLAPSLPPLDPPAVIVGSLADFTLAGSDPDGAPYQLRYELGSTAPAGAQLNPETGRFQWQPVAADVGLHTFEVSVRDSGRPARTTTQAVTLEVLPANVPPTIGAPASVTLLEETSFVFGPATEVLQVDDSDSQGAQLQLSLLMEPETSARQPLLPGELVLGSTSGLQFVWGEADNRPQATITVRGTAADLNGALDGLTFTPRADFQGTARMRLELSDLGNGGSHPVAAVTQTVSFTVRRLPDSPTLAGQTFYLPNYFQSFDPVGVVRAERADPAQVLRYEIVAGNSDQAFAIDPATGMLALAHAESLSPGDERLLTVRVADVGAPGLVATGTVTVSIEPASNQAPYANRDDYRLSEEESMDGNLLEGDAFGGVADADPDGDALVVVAAADPQGNPLTLGQPVQLPSGATVTVGSDGSFAYDAATSRAFDQQYRFSSHETLTYTIADAHGSQQTGTVQLTVDHVNDLHAISDQAFAVSPAAQAGEVVGQLRVVHTEPQESLSWSIGAGDPEQTFRIDPWDGTLRVNSMGGLSVGQSYTLQIDATDEAARTVSAQVTIGVLENEPPQAAALRYQTPEDIPLVGNLLLDDTGAGVNRDPDSAAPLTIVAINGQPTDVGRPLELASAALLQVDADGTFFYDPSSSGFFDQLGQGRKSTEQLTYTLRDTWGAETEATLEIEVWGRNDAPRAADNRYEITGRQQLAGNLLVGNLLVDPGPAGVDTDPDASAALRLATVDGVPVVAETTFSTLLGARLTVRPDGSFEYDPAPAMTSVPAGGRVDDSLVYTVRDEHGLESGPAIGRISIRVGPLTGSPGIEIVDFGLQNDSGLAADDLRSEDPRLRGTLGGALLETADRFELELDLDAAAGPTGYAAEPVADVLLALGGTDSGFPNFQVDPRSVGPFSAAAGRKVVAYRVRALDSDGQLITRTLIDEQGIELLMPAESAWEYFEWDLLDPADQGPLRLAEAIRLANATGPIDQNNPGLVSDDHRSSDPTLTGVLYGDFTNRIVRIEFNHVRDAVTYSGQIELSEPGPFLYDPGAADPQLADQFTPLGVDYRVIVVDTTGALADETIIAGRFDFIYEPISFSAARVLMHETAQVGSLGTSRGVAGTVTGAEQDTVFVQFDQADAAGQFDGLVDGEVTAVGASTAGTGATFEYTAQALAGVAPQLRARVREWSGTAGGYRLGDWSPVLTFSALEGPPIARLEEEQGASGAAAGPRVVGSLQGATGDPAVGNSAGGNPTAGQHDLADVGFVTIQFFHQPEPLDATTPADGTTVTDAQGNFQYEPRGLSYGLTLLQARSVRTLAGSQEKVFGPVSTLYVNLSQPLLPTLPAGNLGLVVPETATYQFLNGASRWRTDDPRLTGTLVQNNPTGIGVGEVRIEFAHDDQQADGDETGVAGYAQPDSQGRFTYLPLDLPLGDVRLRARVAHEDPRTAVTPTGPWTDFYLRVEAAVNHPATVHDLHLTHITSDSTGQQPGTPPRTTDPTVAGHVEDVEGTLKFVTVEFRNANTGVLLGSTTTDA